MVHLEKCLILGIRIVQNHLGSSGISSFEKKKENKFSLIDCYIINRPKGCETLVRRLRREKSLFVLACPNFLRVFIYTCGGPSVGCCLPPAVLPFQ